MHWVGEVDEPLQESCVRHILKRQLPDGGWNIYYGGPSEINASVKAYFALKLAGYSPDLPFMQRSAREHPAAGRHPADEHLQQALSRAARAVPVEISADDSGRNGSAAELGSVSHLQDVVLEPGDAHPARDHQSLQADARLPGDKQLHELYPLGTEHKDFAFAARATLFHLAQFLSPRRRMF